MLDDFRLAFRKLRSAPGFAAAAIVTMALAIGANAAVFAVADAVLFRPLPYEDPDRVFVIRMRDPKTGQQAVTVPWEYAQAIREHLGGLGRMALRGAQRTTSSGTGVDAEWFSATSASPDYFSLLGVRPARGRTFVDSDATDPGSPIVLSYECWQRRFAGDESIVGRSIKIGSTSRDVVGVLPRGFVFPASLVRWWDGDAARPDFVGVAPYPPGKGLVFVNKTFDPIFCLQHGVTREQAQAAIDALIAPIKAADPKAGPEMPVLQDVRSLAFPSGRPAIRALLLCGGLVLLAGSANLAGMLLVRTERRRLDIGIRAALGASRLRIVRPIVFESLILGAAGAALGVLLDFVALDALLPLVPPEAYGSAHVGLDSRVVLFALALGLVSGLLFSAMPAWAAARSDVQVLIKGHHQVNRRPRRVAGHLAVSLQVALAVLLVLAAASAARHVISVLQVPLGFDPENVITLDVMAPQADPRAFYTEALRRLGKRPDVLSASAVTDPPLGRYSASTSDQDRMTWISYVLPGYFETARVSLITGRFPTPGELAAEAGVAVVTEAAARSLFPGLDPVGRTFAELSGRRLIVVGVVRDVLHSLEPQAKPIVYANLPKSKARMVVIVRVRDRSAATLSGVRRDVAAISGDEPVTAVWWADTIRASAPYRDPRFQALVLGSFGALALGLTALGIFSVMAFLVSARTREMGIRMALGAGSRSLVLLAARQALTPVVAGLVAGMLATRWLTELAQSHVVALDTSNTTTQMIAAAVVALCAIIAAYVPARRASAVDPAVVLRAE